MPLTWRPATRARPRLDMMTDAPLQPDREARRDPLDALLAQARWPEPTPQRAARLLEAWDACSPARRPASRWRLAPAGIAAAAAIVIAALGARLLEHRWHRPEPEARAPAVQPSPIDPGAGRREDAAPRVLGVVSRPATPLERWSLLYLAPHARSISSPPGRIERPASQARWESPPDASPGVDARARMMVLRLSLVCDPAARRRTIAGWLADGSPVLLDAAIAALAGPQLRQDAWAAAASAPAPAPDRLLAHFADRHADYRLAAARLLGQACDPAHRRLLEQMAAQNDHRREALAALLCCPDAEASQFLKQLQSDRSLEAQIRSAREQVGL